MGMLFLSVKNDDDDNHHFIWLDCESRKRRDTYSGDFKMSTYASNRFLNVLQKSKYFVYLMFFFCLCMGEHVNFRLNKSRSHFQLMLCEMMEVHLQISVIIIIREI